MLFLPAVRARIIQRLQHHQRVSLDAADLKPAAVVLLLVPHPQTQALSFVITKRATTLRRHSGQWALPGGRIDPGETTIQAGLRELNEELNVDLDAHCVLGRLDDCATRSGYAVTPLVVWGRAKLALAPAPDEVAGVYYIQYDELYGDEVPQLTPIAESDNPVLSIPFASLGTTIYAPTAAIIYQFREVALEGRSTRIDQFEQPLFAWK